jgi:hypothetical protein
MMAEATAERDSAREVQMRSLAIILAAGLTTIPLAVGPVAAAEPVSAQTIAAAMGFSAKDRARLQAGEILSSEIEETDEKQLAVALALMVPATLEDVAASVAQGTTLEANKAIKAYGEIDPAQVGEAAFAGITLDAGEVKRLLEVEPGSELNLSADEIAVFQDLAQQHKAGDAAAADAVNAAWRQVLAGRLQAYLAGGLDGIALYDRGGDSSSAADDLRAAAEAATLVQQAVPELYQAFLAFPDRGVADAENRFFWTEQVADDRPVYVLTHRMMQQQPDRLVLLSRDFYVSHSFNASQGTAGALPVDGGVVIFYGNRTSSDQVAGFMSGMRHEIGRGMMRDSLVKAMEEIRTAWQP